MAGSKPLDTTLQRLREQQHIDLDHTLPDAGATLDPARPADPAGQRALAVLSQLSGGRAPAQGGAFTLERTLGQGGMGIVHLGTQVALGRKVAVKTLRPEHRSASTEMQLLREAWVTGALEHPNVVPVYDLGLDGDGHPYIILKRIEGTEWENLMRDDEKVRARFGADDLLEWNLQILMQVCNALGFAHSRGIVHRDLKPENVMIGEFGEVYVLDWGIAVSLREDGSGRLPLAAEQRELSGTPSYMAPEMLDGNAARLSPRTDVYLLGAVLYEIMTGHAPHEGQTLGQVLGKVLASNPPFPDGTEPELMRICRRALAADPDARFENVQQLRLALQGFLHRRGSAQLAAEAEARLGQLVADLRAPDGEPVARRLQLYNLFGECRFGFEQALRSWRDNEPARDGLLRATAAMIEYELAQGDPKAAALLAGGLASVPPELRARIAEAERAWQEARERSEKLVKLGSQWDASVGRRTRVYLATLLGSVWTLVPLTIPRWPFLSTYPGMTLLTGSLIVLMGALSFWARESLSKTALNRSLVVACAFTVTSQTMLQQGAALLGIPPHTTQVLYLALWFCCSGIVVMTVDRRLVLASGAFLIGFMVSCIWPAWVFVAMSASNAVLTVMLLKVWRAHEFAHPSWSRRS
jgi:serine/threonine-protein kinase